jgi:hypothetical protein
MLVDAGREAIAPSPNSLSQEPEGFDQKGIPEDALQQRAGAETTAPQTVVMTRCVCRLSGTRCGYAAIPGTLLCRDCRFTSPPTQAGRIYCACDCFGCTAWPIDEEETKIEEVADDARTAGSAGQAHTCGSYSACNGDTMKGCQAVAHAAVYAPRQRFFGYVMKQNVLVCTALFTKTVVFGFKFLGVMGDLRPDFWAPWRWAAMSRRTKSAKAWLRGDRARQAAGGCCEEPEVWWARRQLRRQLQHKHDCRQGTMTVG